VRRDIPTGTVTFLFTDVEGSTRLLHELGADAYAQALAEHRRVIRDACAAEGGVEVDTQGDAFFFAFPTAPGAVAAAEAMTEALASGPIQVRIGLHTGTPLLTGEGYVGGDVHRAARIAAVGYGGQVLVSSSTAQLAETDLLDLGEHRLKDLSAPERVYQLGDGEFPPLKSLCRTNLPVPATPFLGRERELAEVVGLLGDTRLLTLTGPGGTGKTRLALQAAAVASDAYSDGVYWVPLATALDPELVLPSAAQAVAAKDGVAAHIADKRLLLLFDNFEQVVAAAADVAGLLGSCPNLDILVTSRERLQVSGEQEYPVPPLAHDEGVDFFLARARTLRSDFEPGEVISAICRRLDDLPLALELAAARVTALTPEQILERLDERLPLLTGGARDLPARQRTLRATIEWSHDLLSADEQHLFARLSVFAGGCTLAAAEEVAEADLDTLQSLVEKSLVRFAVSRYWMLETIREYATERLAESGGDASARGRHAAYFARLADCRWPALVVGTEDWREVVEQEHENLRAAVEWSLEKADGGAVLAIGSGVWPYWLERGYGRQAREWLERALALPPAEPSERRAHAVIGLADIASFQGDFEVAERAFEESLDFFRAHDQARWIAACLSSLADLALTRGDLARARLLAEESVALRREIGSIGLGRGLASVAEVALAEGNLDEARTVSEQALEWQRAELPGSAHLPAILTTMAEVARRQEDLGASRRLIAEALETAARFNDEVQVVAALELMAVLATTDGDSDRAARLAGWAERVREQSGLARSRPYLPLPERIEPAWSEGSAMSFDEAVAYAREIADA
jgi:predicted ATPase/class 3 adenylate cyclase